MERIIEPNTIQTGAVYMRDNTIMYRCGHKAILEVNLADVVLLGEYTINNHPLNKGSWHLVFVHGNGSWKSIPWFTENMQQLSGYLAFRFHASFGPEDLPKTLWGKSIIRYPHPLKGRPLFCITPPERFRLPLTIFNKALSLLSLGRYRGTWQVALTEEVKAYLQL